VADIVKHTPVLGAALREAWEERDAANADRVELSRKLGELQGKYEAAHWPGIVEGWKERTEAAESRLEQSSKDAMSAGYGQGYEAAMGVAIKRIDKLEAALKMAEDYLGRMSVREIGEINAVVVAVVLGEIESALAAQPAPEGERA
jgi:hypothetical protein